MSLSLHVLGDSTGNSREPVSSNDQEKSASRRADLRASNASRLGSTGVGCLSKSMPDTKQT